MCLTSMMIQLQIQQLNNYRKTQKSEVIWPSLHQTLSVWRKLLQNLKGDCHTGQSWKYWMISMLVWLVYRMFKKNSRVLKHNPGLEWLNRFNRVINGEEFYLNKEIILEDSMLFKNAPMVMVDMEIFCSQYGTILEPQRQRQIVENIKNHALVLLNNFS